MSGGLWIEVDFVDALKCGAEPYGKSAHRILETAVAAAERSLHNEPSGCPGCGRRVKWTPNRIIETLCDWAQLSGRTPTAKMAQQPAAPVNLHTAQRVFGSWSAAIEAAGLKPNRTGRPTPPPGADEQ